MTIPLDPMDEAAMPPADVDDCECCAGTGTVPVERDPDTGRWYSDACPWCDGSGNHNTTRAGAA